MNDRTARWRQHLKIILWQCHEPHFCYSNSTITCDSYGIYSLYQVYKIQGITLRLKHDQHVISIWNNICSFLCIRFTKLCFRRKICDCAIDPQLLLPFHQCFYHGNSDLIHFRAKTPIAPFLNWRRTTVWTKSQRKHHKSKMVHRFHSHAGSTDRV